MRRMNVPGAAAVIVLALVLAGWMILSPRWAAGLLAEQAAQQLDRRIDVKGGATLEFTPQLAVRLNHVTLSNPTGMEGTFITAKSVRIPMGFADLLTRSPDLSTMELDGAEFAFLVNERNDTSWAFPSVKTPRPLRLDLADSSMRFYDARSAQAFSLAGARMTVDIGAEGDVTVKGTADMGGRLAKIDALLKSLSRVDGGGSPLDLSIEVPDGTVSFNGRLSSVGLLNLAGPITIEAPDVRAAAQWAGLDVVESGETGSALFVSGALESAGRAFAIRRADIKLGDTLAQGDVVLDLRKALPKLQAILATPSLSIDPYLPDSGASTGDWGTRPMEFHLLKAIDTDITVQAGNVSIGRTVVGPAKVTAAIDGGKLKAELSVPVLGSGSFSLETSLDVSAIPPSFGLNIRGDNVDMQSFSPMLAPVTWLTGRGSINVSLSGSGQSQQEIIGTLKGSIILSLADGDIAGPDVGVMLKEVNRRIIAGWTDAGGAGHTPFKILSSEAKLSDGIATLSSGRLETDGVSITAKGNVDLLRRAVDLTIQPNSADAGDRSADLPVPVIVKGPWGSPRIYPDLPDVLAKPQEAFDRLKAAAPAAAN